MRTKLPLIFVKAVTTDAHVVLFEQHEDHPNGEVFITDDQPHQVAKTDAVIEHLRTGVLVEVEPVEVEEAAEDE